MPRKEVPLKLKPSHQTSPAMISQTIIWSPGRSPSPSAGFNAPIDVKTLNQIRPDNESPEPVVFRTADPTPQSLRSEVKPSDQKPPSSSNWVEALDKLTSIYQEHLSLLTSAYQEKLKFLTPVTEPCVLPRGVSSEDSSSTSTADDIAPATPPSHPTPDSQDFYTSPKSQGAEPFEKVKRDVLIVQGQKILNATTIECWANTLADESTQERVIPLKTECHKLHPSVVRKLQHLTMQESRIYVAWKNGVSKLTPDECVAFEFEAFKEDQDDNTHIWAGFRGVDLVFLSQCELRCFDTEAEVWFEIPANPAEERPVSPAVMAVFKDMIVAYGDRLHVYRKNTWRAMHSALHEGNLLLVPGDTGLALVVSASNNVSSSVWWLDMRPVIEDFNHGMPEWKQLSDKGIDGAGAGIYNGKLYIFGGCLRSPLTKPGVVYFNDILVLDLITRAWSRLKVDGTPEVGCGYVYSMKRGTYGQIAIDPLHPPKKFLNLITRECKWKGVHPIYHSAPLPRSKACVEIKDGWMYVGGTWSSDDLPAFDEWWKISLDAPMRRWQMVNPGTYWELKSERAFIAEQTSNSEKTPV